MADAGAQPKPFSLKLIVFGAVTLVFAGVFWYLVSQLMAGGLSEKTLVNTAGVSVATLLAFSVFISLLALVGVLSSRRRERWTMVVLVSLVPFIFFPLHFITVLAVLIVAVATLLYLWTVGKEARARIHFSFTRVIKADLTLTIALILIAVSTLYYGMVSNQGNDPDQVLTHLTGSTTTIVERVLPLVYHGYSADITVDEFIRQQLPNAQKMLDDFKVDPSLSREAKRQALEQKLRDLGVDPATVDVNVYLDDTERAQAQFEQSLNAELVSIQDEAIQATRDQLAQNFRVTLTGKERLADAIDMIVTQNVNRLVRPYAGVVPAILALSLFFFLWVFTFLYEYLIRGVGELLYLSLRAGKAVSIVRETVEAERLTL